jgi:hypothetical protein
MAAQRGLAKKGADRCLRNPGPATFGDSLSPIQAPPFGPHIAFPVLADKGAVFSTMKVRRRYGEASSYWTVRGAKSGAFSIRKRASPVLPVTSRSQSVGSSIPAAARKRASPVLPVTSRSQPVGSSIPAAPRGGAAAYSPFCSLYQVTNLFNPSARSTFGL